MAGAGSAWLAESAGAAFATGVATAVFAASNGWTSITSTAVGVAAAGAAT